ncbi:hypothetical protein [Halostagnicola sp. A-GB9-2]|uniref:DUF7511 domain-containing protein n=1 Tax=Halostagnicola sp. A-GB9-2 TaxID=3048066 RepID=UPI0024C071B0|nr:hypothetical protein [Halostagnicola sp. A-GB9-2]MDJ1431267.1 hypothetical protein [Halostagnicola sp. A-GB9-2]
MTAHDPTDDGDADGEQGTTRGEQESTWEEQRTTRGESKSGDSPADSTSEIRSLDCRSVVEPDEHGTEICTIYDMSDPRTKQTAWLSAEDDSFVDLEEMQ